MEAIIIDKFKAANVKNLKNIFLDGNEKDISFYILKPDSATSSITKEVIIFNKETNDSRGFDEYIDKKVQIIGKEIIGYIGWRKEAKPGMLVEEIKILN